MKILFDPNGKCKHIGIQDMTICHSILPFSRCSETEDSKSRYAFSFRHIICAVRVSIGLKNKLVVPFSNILVKSEQTRAIFCNYVRVIRETFKKKRGTFLKIKMLYKAYNGDSIKTGWTFMENRGDISKCNILLKRYNGDSEQEWETF